MLFSHLPFWCWRLHHKENAKKNTNDSLTTTQQPAPIVYWQTIPRTTTKTPAVSRSLPLPPFRFWRFRRVSCCRNDVNLQDLDFFRGFRTCTRRIGKEDNLIYTLPKFNSSPLKNDGWKTILPFGMVYFQGRTVKLPGGTYIDIYIYIYLAMLRWWPFWDGENDSFQG